MAALGAQIQAGKAVESQCWECRFIQPPDVECKAAPLLKGSCEEGRGEFTRLALKARLRHSVQSLLVPQGDATWRMAHDGRLYDRVRLVSL